MSADYLSECVHERIVEQKAVHLGIFDVVQVGVKSGHCGHGCKFVLQSALECTIDKTREWLGVVVNEPVVIGQLVNFEQIAKFCVRIEVIGHGKQTFEYHVDILDVLLGVEFVQVDFAASVAHGTRQLAELFSKIFVLLDLDQFIVLLNSLFVYLQAAIGLQQRIKSIENRRCTKISIVYQDPVTVLNGLDQGRIDPFKLHFFVVRQLVHQSQMFAHAQPLQTFSEHFAQLFHFVQVFIVQSVHLFAAINKLEVFTEQRQVGENSSPILSDYFGSQVDQSLSQMLYFLVASEQIASIGRVVHRKFDQIFSQQTGH
ncbi:hypothetical protein BpHYR1_007851 [Brachionus plicatilis]|uniref:Uncharacterized protein n=1 Tax=Brachionus plicatilis TaxID=10195 RepID=A0A3M7SXF4_BRAPC|nr:hypothetical protein BpHYR1_007851 [Brachionus plicatilis]